MAPPPPTKKGNVARSHRISSRNGAERSAYFARREAAAVLRRVLQDDAARCATASIKSLVYSPSVRNKKATFALVCQTLKCLPIIKDVLVATQILNSKWKKQAELVYVTLYDILFGQEIAMTGAVEKFLTLHKNKLEYALAKICARRKIKKIEDLLQNNCVPVASKPRYIRINTLKVDAEFVMQELGKTNIMISRDDIIPDVLSLTSGVDLHDHPLVRNGSIFLQGKASSMVAVALNPIPGWKVLDACAAPGNKTAHLAALMKGQGKIIACELNEDRLETLEETIRRSGAPNVDVVHGDFLDINTRDPLFKEVRAILLDPSCSGSGISAERLDHLLPSYEKGVDADACKSDRVKKLAAFQTKALLHALSYGGWEEEERIHLYTEAKLKVSFHAGLLVLGWNVPAVERVVYSTCSVYQTENEDVIKSVLPFAKSLHFQLVSPFPQWPHRGLPVFDGAEHLLRTDPKEDTEGFFIALFVKKSGKTNKGNRPSTAKKLTRQNRYTPYPFCKLSTFWFHKRLTKQGSKKINH